MVKLLTQVTHPLGDAEQYAYDARGNVTSLTKVPVPGSGLSNIVVSANYDLSCTNPAKCNKPNNTVDARNNATTYTYNPTTGQVLTITKPAPTSGAVQPVITNTYSQQFAYYFTAPGSLTQGPSSISLLASSSMCATTASCSGTSDQIVTSMAYGSAGVANNLLPTSVTTAAGDGTLSAPTTTSYDTVGNKAIVTAPLGSNYATMYLYDADLEQIGVIGPVPGPSEPGLPNPATRTTYNTDGLVTLIEKGTVTAQTSAAFANFSSLEQTATAYDGLDRKTAVSQTA
ncbi:MAG: hypothetical protein ACRDQZ_10100, partial [Mycobacteriales bacterium]